MAGTKTDYMKLIDEWVQEILNQKRKPTEIVISKQINDYMVRDLDRRARAVGVSLGEVARNRLKSLETRVGPLPVRVEVDSFIAVGVSYQ